MIRSILAIVGGFLTMGILGLVGDAATQRAVPGAFDSSGFTTNSAVLAVTVLYTAIGAAIGGYVTAWLSRRQDLRNVWILTGVEAAATLAANIFLFDSRLLWFYAAVFVIGLSAIPLGGKLYLSRRSGRTAAA